MQFHHQRLNSVGRDLYNGCWYRNVTYYPHFHRGYEIIMVLSGSITATVADKNYLVKEGEALFLTPYQNHSFQTKNASEIFITVFSGTHVGRFASTVSNRFPEDAQFTPSPETLSLVKKHLVHLPTDPSIDIMAGETPPVFALKACLYALCSDFSAVATWKDCAQDQELAYRILNYVEQNYTENISLSSLAESLSYEYHYLSRIFRESIRVRFCELVNQYRCERAGELISTTDLPLSTIALNCGFQSIRSFNRVFLRLTGRTPSQARARYRQVEQI